MSSRYISNTAKNKNVREKFYFETYILLERNYMFEKTKKQTTFQSWKSDYNIKYKKNWNCANWIEDKYAPEELMEKRLLKY